MPLPLELSELVYTLLALLPPREVMLLREMLNMPLPFPKRLSAENALDILPTLLSLTAMLGVGALLAR